jgi:hypothetical protein
MVQAMRYVLEGMTPYAAAKRVEVTLAAMYRSRLYKLWRDGNLAELEKEMDFDQTPRQRPARQ